MDRKFNKAYFEQFDIVLNALDNVAARRHVNRMCLGANVPLIESGMCVANLLPKERERGRGRGRGRGKGVGSWLCVGRRGGVPFGNMRSHRKP